MNGAPNEFYYVQTALSEFGGLRVRKRKTVLF